MKVQNNDNFSTSCLVPVFSRTIHLSWGVVAPDLKLYSAFWTVRDLTLSYIAAGFPWYENSRILSETWSCQVQNEQELVVLYCHIHGGSSGIPYGVNFLHSMSQGSVLQICD